MVPFRPIAAKTVNINVSASNQRVLVSDNPNIDAIRVMNNGTATAWCDFGDVATVAATTTGFPVGPGVTEVLRPNKTGGGPVYAAAIAAGTTGQIYFTPGSGI